MSGSLNPSVHKEHASELRLEHASNDFGGESQLPPPPAHGYEFNGPYISILILAAKQLLLTFLLELGSRL